jgi:integrase
MSLTDISVRKAKARAKEYKLADGGGLYLLVTPSGGRLWRLKYRLHGLEKKLSFGPYPELSLGDARKLRDAARAVIAGGDDPAVAKRRQRIVARLAVGTTFGDVALEYIEKCIVEGKAASTIAKLRWSREWLLHAVGSRPVNEIQPHEILGVLKKQGALGQLETAKRTRAFASRVFRYAVATARATADPAALLVGAVAAPRARHLSAIVDAKRVGDLLRAIKGYEGQPATKLALELLPHVFVRPGELRQAEWSEVDFQTAVWRLPAARMKMRREHAVPLSKQSVVILERACAISGAGHFVFPAIGKRGRPLSENTMTQALRRMGFPAEEMTAHGFRAMASTLLNESGKWSSDAIERALAHSDRNQVRAAYHRGAHWSERVAMAQWWSDHLDFLQTGAAIVKLPAANVA